MEGGSVITLTAETQNALFREGEAAYPDECCGFVTGRADGDVRAASGVLPIGNARERAEAYHRFEIAPSDFLAAERAAAEAGVDIIGIYHSHPDHPAAPSDYDLEHALPYYSYLILPVVRGKAGRLASWRLEDDRSGFAREALSLR
jgi:proteasome lid subunit RPN8/RPN11